jgi:hypothetical protein
MAGVHRAAENDMNVAVPLSPQCFDTTVDLRGYCQVTVHKSNEEDHPITPTS